VSAGYGLTSSVCTGYRRGVVMWAVRAIEREKSRADIVMTLECERLSESTNHVHQAGMPLSQGVSSTLFF